MGKHENNKQSTKVGDYTGKHRAKEEIVPPTTKMDDRGSIYGLSSRLRQIRDNK